MWAKRQTTREVWRLAAAQHGVVARRQLAELGFSRRAIEHRVAKGRLHPVRWRGVYVIGRPELTRHGRWIAAVLACGPKAMLSHESAAALWGIRDAERELEVTLAASSHRHPPGIRLHRRPKLEPRDVGRRDGIPLTSLTRTLLDLAPRLAAPALERAINEADRLDLIDPEGLRTDVDRHRSEPGVAVLRALLDRGTFTLTDSELEQRFLPLAARAGLPPPLTRQMVNGFRVDFYWPGLGLVVETDGLRYHRTPAQQARAAVRDQAHAAAGLTPLRFTRAQVHYEPGRVELVLARVARRLAERPA